MGIEGNEDDESSRCLVVGCPRQASVSIRFADGTHRYCESCAAAAQRQVMQPKLVTFDNEISTVDSERATMTENPFTKHADILRADYGAAIRIQGLVLHLFHGANPVDMGYLMRGTDARHRAVVFDMLHWYAEHGESDSAFMEAAERLST